MKQDNLIEREMEEWAKDKQFGMIVFAAIVIIPVLIFFVTL